MRASRLATVGIAAGATVLGLAGPALATPPATKAEPKATVSPSKFTSGAKLTLTVTECTETPTATAGTIFTAAPKFTGTAGKLWTAVQATRTSLKPGQTYTSTITCKFGDQTKTLTLSVNPGKPTDPKPEPPKFSFGYDDVKLSSTRVAPGRSTVFTVTCPTAVTITSNGYTKNPLTVKRTGKTTWTATGTFKSSLPDPTTATVVCKGYGPVKFSTSPEKGDMTPKKPSGKIPTGPIQTGDGSMAGNGGSTMSVLAAGIAVPAAFGGLMLLRRRAGREQS